MNLARYAQSAAWFFILPMLSFQSAMTKMMTNYPKRWRFTQLLQSSRDSIVPVMTMPFLTDIQVKRRPGADVEWELLTNLIYEGKRDRFVVPSGFKTDFASIPRIFQRLIPKNGKHDAAAIIHDYLYRYQPSVLVRPCPTSTCSNRFEQINRLDADRIFLRIMEELGVGYLRRNLMYRAVRIAGGSSWDKSRKLLDAE